MEYILQLSEQINNTENNPFTYRVIPYERVHSIRAFYNHEFLVFFVWLRVYSVFHVKPICFVYTERMKELNQ